MRGTGAILLLSILLLGGDFTGYMKFYAHQSLVSPYGFTKLGSRLQLNLKKSLGKIDFFSSLDFDMRAEEQGRGLSLYPVEAYITFHWSSVDLRIGRQFVFWGRTDWINPTDNITPWDYTNITAEIEDYRLSVDAAKLDWYFGNSSLELVLVPFFKPNITGMEIPGAKEVLPEQKPENWQEGLRFSSEFSGLNFSLSYWKGFDLYPTVVPDMQGGLTVQHPRQQVFGADFDYALGSFVIKGEGAYFLTQDREGTDPFVKNPYLHYVLALEWAASSNLTADLQFVEKRVLRWHQGLMGPYEERISRSASLVFTYKREGYWKLQLISVYNFKDGDYFLLPIFTYEFADGVNIYLGATLFRGPEESPFGRLKDSSRAFLEVKYSF